jgi:hypothetical protein
MGTTQLQLLQGTFLLGAAAPLAEHLEDKAVLHRAATITLLAAKAERLQAPEVAAEAAQQAPTEMAVLGPLVVLVGLLAQAARGNTMVLAGVLAEALEEAKHMLQVGASQHRAAEELVQHQEQQSQSL